MSTNQDYPAYEVFYDGDIYSLYYQPSYSASAPVLMERRDSEEECWQYAAWLEGGRPVAVVGKSDVLNVRLLSIRAALRLQIQGMRLSRGLSARTMANTEMGTNHKTAVKTYEAFNRHIVDLFGAEFDRPL